MRHMLRRARTASTDDVVAEARRIRAVEKNRQFMPDVVVPTWRCRDDGLSAQSDDGAKACPGCHVLIAHAHRAQVTLEALSLLIFTQASFDLLDKAAEEPVQESVGIGFGKAEVGKPLGANKEGAPRRDMQAAPTYRRLLMKPISSSSALTGGPRPSKTGADLRDFESGVRPASTCRRGSPLRWPG